MRRLAYGLAASFAGALALPWACGLENGGTGETEHAGADDARALDTTIEAPGTEGGPIENDGGLDVDLSDAPDAPDARDAETDAPDAAACIAKCTGGTCDGGHCTITCTDAVTCGNTDCPNGLPCTINCVGQNTCDNVTCSNCDVLCSGFHACAGNVTCTGPGCKIRCCGAADACKGNATCTGTGCGVVCGADGGACGADVKCNGGACGDAGVRCP